MEAVRRFTRAELEQIARDEYQRQVGKAAPAKVRNAQALVALGEHRALRWRGHAYRVPPVPFREGAQLLVCSQVMAAERVPERERERAARLACAVMDTLIERRLRRFRRNPFRGAPHAELLHLIQEFFLAIPDEAPTPAGKPQRVVDLVDGFFEFTETFPALVGADGLPVSWMHYQLGLRRLGKVHARATLRAAQAARAAHHADKDGWRDYGIELRSAAGWD